MIEDEEVRQKGVCKIKVCADMPKLGDTILNYCGGCDEFNSRIAE